MYSVNANGPDGVPTSLNNDLDFIFGTDFLSNLAVSNLLLSVYYSCTMHSLSISHVDMRQRNPRHRSYYWPYSLPQSSSELHPTFRLPT